MVSLNVRLKNMQKYSDAEEASKLGLEFKKFFDGQAKD
jgi:hypothetical protein